MTSVVPSPPAAAVRVAARRAGPPPPGPLATLGRWAAAAGLGTGALYVVWLVYLSGEPVWAVALLGLVAVAFAVYLSDLGIVYRYLFPGVTAMAVFVLFPLLYTVQLGFTNFSSSNLLSFERATAYLLERAEPADTGVQSVTLHADGAGIRLRLTARDAEEGAAPAVFVTPPLPLAPAAAAAGTDAAEVAATPLADAAALGPALPLAEVVARRQALAALRIRLPAADGQPGALLHYLGLREFGPLEAEYRRQADGSLLQVATGKVFVADHAAGFWRTAAGERLQPGFKVDVGAANYVRILADPEFRGPFLRIFLWTVAFAGLTVLFSTLVGCTLAVLLNWEALRFRTLYRTLVFLPYAVPGFISILVFKGLFNQNFGEINLVLDALFGIRPRWFDDPLLAKTMILIVNTWLGYPYVMVLTTGLLKAIPSDLYEASAIAGAGPLTNFFRITLPLIVRPLTPLLIAAFAYNFNNFVLISLLTDGRPDFLNTRVPAGTTDILVSYTYRIAFQDSGQNFGLAAAISTLIFVLVAAMSLANLRLMKVNRAEPR